MRESMLALRSSSAYIIRAKCRAPGVPDHRVVRERLLPQPEVLERMLVSTIVAPAGFGKTTLLSEIHAKLHRLDQRAAWLTLDVNDNDAGRLIHHLQASLRQAGLQTSADAQDPSDTSQLIPEDAAGHLLDQIERQSGLVYWLLDDFDAVRSEDSLQVFRTLIRHAPANLRILLASRTRPAIHLAELRATGNLLEIDLAQMRFTAEEAHRLLGTGVSPQQVSALVRSVEGWPVVLRLTQHWLQEGVAPTRELAQSGSRAVQLAQYFSEEILSSLRPELASFLSRVSIHDRMCIDLAYHLTGCGNSGALLDELAEHNLLLLCADEGHCWYRQHKLVLHFFRDRLHRQHADEIRTLHWRAAEWLSTHGFANEAIEHAELAQDHGFALKLTEQAGGWRITLGTGGSSLRVLRGLEDAPATLYPRVQLGKVFAALQMGTVIEAREIFELMRVSTSDFGCDSSAGIDDTFLFETQLMDNLLMYYEDRPMDLQRVEQITERFAATPGVDPTVLAIREAARCCGCLDAADYNRCRELAAQVIVNIGSRNLMHVEYYMRLFTGLSYLHQGSFPQALDNLQVARTFALKSEEENNVHLAFVEVLLAELYYEADDLASARQLVDRSLPLLEKAGGFLDVLASGYATQAALAASDKDLAGLLEILLHAEEVARRARLGRLSDLMAIRRVRELIRFGEIELAARHWEALDERLLRPLDTVPSRDLRICGAARLVGARLLSAMGRTDDALNGIDALEPMLEQYGFHRLSREAGLIKAGCLYQLGEFDAAHAELGRVSAFEADKQYCRLFIDEKPLLDEVRSTSGSGGPAEPLASSACAFGMFDQAYDDLPAPVAALESGGDRLSLSPRESEVIVFLADGLSNKEIARRIGIAEGTVKIYRKNIYRKLDVRSRSGVIQKGRSLALLR